MRSVWVVPMTLMHGFLMMAGIGLLQRVTFTCLPVYAVSNWLMKGLSLYRQTEWKNPIISSINSTTPRWLSLCSLHRLSGVESERRVCIKTGFSLPLPESVLPLSAEALYSSISSLNLMYMA